MCSTPDLNASNNIIGLIVGKFVILYRDTFDCW